MLFICYLEVISYKYQFRTSHLCSCSRSHNYSHSAFSFRYAFLTGKEFSLFLECTSSPITSSVLSQTEKNNGLSGTQRPKEHEIRNLVYYPELINPKAQTIMFPKLSINLFPSSTGNNTSIIHSVSSKDSEGFRQHTDGTPLSASEIPTPSFFI